MTSAFYLMITCPERVAPTFWSPWSLCWARGRASTLPKFSS